MRLSMLFFLCCVAFRVTSHKIRAVCDEVHDFPPTKLKNSPSMVAGLNVTLVRAGEENKLNISWAINIDASINYLNGTWIDISGRSAYICNYNPPFTSANLTGLEQEWFYFLKSLGNGFWSIKIYNIPLPPLGAGPQSKSAFIQVPRQKKANPTNRTTIVTTGDPQQTSQMAPPVAEETGIEDATLIFVGVVASIIIMSSCFIIYKIFVSFSGFEIIPVAPMAPVSVLVVYPAETPAFQRSVVALVEFLQWHGGCKVAIDMWQQEKIAELGPLRWLAEQVKVADRVLIITPLVETSSFLPGHSTPTKNLPEHSIPAAAHDLYPLILRIVASHAKSATELAKFWVVQLHAQKDKKSRVLLPELQTCRTFCLMKDLNRLCKSLHAQRKVGKKILPLLFKPEIFYSRNSTVKLREAIKILGTKKPGISDRMLNKDLC